MDYLPVTLLVRMEVTRWKFEFETTPSIIGIGVFTILGMAGFFILETRMVFLPVAFLAGVVAGLLSSSHSQTGNNGIVVSLVGFFLIMAFSAAQHVSGIAESRNLSLGDQLFLTFTVILAEAFLAFVTILPLGYIGAMLVGIIRKKWQPAKGPRDFRNLGR